MWDQLQLLSEPPVLPPGEQAAVLVALFEDDVGVVRVALIKRPMTMPTHAGHLGFPGGRTAPEDGGPVATALREAEEEVGIEPGTVEVLGFLPAVDTVESGIHVVPVVGRLSRSPRFVLSDREVEKMLCPDLVGLSDPTRWTNRWLKPYTVWYTPVEDETLWGASAWMIRKLLGMAD